MESGFCTSPVSLEKMQECAIRTLGTGGRAQPRDAGVRVQEYNVSMDDALELRELPNED